MRGGKSGFDAVYGNRAGRVGHECVVGCRHVVAKPVLDGPITREKRTNAFADHIAFRGALASSDFCSHRIGQFGRRPDGELPRGRMMTWEATGEMQAYSTPTGSAYLDRASQRFRDAALPRRPTAHGVRVQRLNTPGSALIFRGAPTVHRRGR